MNGDPEGGLSVSLRKRSKCGPLTVVRRIAANLDFTVLVDANVADSFRSQYEVRYSSS